jgi:hypothetical protein
VFTPPAMNARSGRDMGSTRCQSRRGSGLKVKLNSEGGTTMARTPKPTPKRTPGPYKIRGGEIWAFGNPLDVDECIGTVYRAEGWTEGEPIRTEDQANAAFVGRAMECHDDLLAALKTARTYVEASLDDVRDSQPALDAAFPPRSVRMRAEDAITITEIEAHLALIDRAIARAEPPS